MFVGALYLVFYARAIMMKRRMCNLLWTPSLNLHQRWGELIRQLSNEHAPRQTDCAQESDELICFCTYFASVDVFNST